MISIPIRSRVGNFLLLVLGVLFTAASAALLVLSITATWGYAGTFDHLAQALLLAIAITGLLLALGARRNLQRTGAIQGAIANSEHVPAS